MRFEIKDGVLTKCILEGATSVTVPDGVTEIGEKAFLYDVPCILEDVYIPDSVKVIGRAAFEYNQNLKKVRLPRGLEKIGRAAFERCQCLKEIDIPENVEDIGEYAFAYCSALEKIVIPGKVKRLKENTFALCTSLKEAVLSEGLASVGPDAFFSCTSLEYVSLPSTLKKLSQSFMSCESLKEIVIPGSVKEIGKYSFALCKSLKKVTINPGLGKIGPFAFWKSGIESVSVPDSVTEIGENAFASCGKLKKAKLPLYMKNLQKGIFKYCNNLEDVSIPETAVNIDGDAFYESGIRNLYIPASVRKIGIDPDSVSNDMLTDEADALNPFAGCRDLVNIEVDPANEVYYSEKNCIIDRKNKFVVAGCLTSTIPSDVNGIGVRAFNGIPIEKIDIPDSVIKILDLAFHNAGIKELTIPDNAVSLGREIITADGALVTYTGHAYRKNLFSFKGNTFLAYPNISRNTNEKHLNQMSVGYGIHCLRTGKKYASHKVYLKYIRHNVVKLVEFAVKYLYPNGIDFLKFIFLNKLINEKDLLKISAITDVEGNAELTALFIEYKMSFLKDNPIGILEEGLEDL